MNTSDGQLDAAVQVLRTERDGLNGQVKSVRDQLDLHERRLAAVEQALQALEVLQRPVGQGSTAASPSDQPLEETDGLHEGQHAPAPADTSNRINSSDAVTQVVRQANRPLTRQEIKVRFEQQGLVPDSWKHPANALNNAIARAEKRGLIQRRGDLFAIDFPEKTESGTLEIGSEV